MPSYAVTVDGESIVVVTGNDGTVMVKGSPQPTAVIQTGQNEFLVLGGSGPVPVAAVRREDGYEVVLKGMHLEVQVETERMRLLGRLSRSSGSAHKRMEIRAPMPALVVRVEVSPGEVVQSGTGLLVLEAMKMENELKAHHAGKVKEVLVKSGEAVEKGELLIVLE